MLFDLSEHLSYFHAVDELGMLYDRDSMVYFDIF